MKSNLSIPAGKSFTLKAFLVLWLLTLPIGLHAQTAPDGASYLQQIEKRYENVNTFRAKFLQISKAPGVVKTEKASGIVYLRKDGKFRWDYDKPEVVLIVSDGKTLWIYQAEDKQVMIDESFGKKLKRFPYTFLNGMQRLHEDFDAKVLNSKGKMVTLELIPKKNLKEITKMLITFDKDTLLIKKIQWVSSQEVKTIITFDDIDITSKIPDSVFHFEPPEGVDIVRADTP
ncbi:MAG: outer membrane lipoprotein chaperone LolA [Deltaproteobacteria bacterium]|nr:outer membrane lipoprotein chaperone LolA [Deltaproteobacteria bacterium]